MIGARIRGLPQHTLLFEKIINTIHQKVPPFQNTTRVVAYFEGNENIFPTHQINNAPIREIDLWTPLPDLD
jgi:hypothetical protein